MIPGATVHLLIALVWMFLSGNTTLGGLAIGLAGGFALMALFRKALGCQSYIRRVKAGTLFIGHLVQQIVMANLRLARTVLRKDAALLHGEFLPYSVEGLTDTEVLLLCQCISLTPGTIVADRSEDGRVITLHAFASGTPEEIRRSIDKELKQPILSFTR